MPHKYYNAVNCFYKNYLPLNEIWQKYGSWAKAWKYISQKEIDARSIDPEKEWRRLLKHDVRLILQSDDDFPPLLREMPQAPFGIYIKGAPIFNNLSVAIVGTRRATAEGKRLSAQFGKELARYGAVVVSGLALGVDQFAHQGALESKGLTIAVLANGLDHIYPPSNRGLGEKIINSGGALVSEYPLGTPSFPSNFLERNRIISGLSRGVLVIEAPIKSGSLNTAKFALEQNRDIFVIPGPINHPNYQGSNKLIQSGARLVTDHSDILLDFGFSPVKFENNSEGELTKEQQSVLNYIESAGQSLPIDKIAQLTKLEPHVVNQALAFLTIKGIVKESGGKYTL